MEISLDPWGTTDIKNYDRLFELFGIEPIEPLLNKIPNPSRHLRRRIDFGHRDLPLILQAIERNEPYAVMSGIKPTGVFHLGSRITAEKMIYFQSLSRKAIVFYAIADIEAYTDNGLSFEETSEIAVQNVADILALGLDPKRTVVYKQSEATPVMDLAFIFSRGVTLNMVEAIYGSRPFGLFVSALVQAGDILVPQLKRFGGPKPVLVPVGADQDPHIRLARDLARRHTEKFHFIPPSAIYHKLSKSLTGDSKMSKRDPMSMLTLDDSPKLAQKKVMNALTGGRTTIEEQRKLGGEPDKCVVYDLYREHFIEDDEKTTKVYNECKGGERMCGDCKLEIANFITDYLNKHQQKRKKLFDTATVLLDEGREKMTGGL